MDERRLEQVQREHGDFGVLSVGAGEVAVLAEFQQQAEPKTSRPSLVAHQPPIVTDQRPRLDQLLGRPPLTHEPKP
ncbi:hypothetical protein [Nocardia sp. NPDC004604]|uniref:hypothetical protein n=1 Tax=Nocardia sp. NPDC004604 TaxID=3157013 RepID=UPI0033A053DC